MKTKTKIILSLSCLVSLLICACEKEMDNQDPVITDVTNYRVKTAERHQVNVSSEYHITSIYNYDGDDLTINEMYENEDEEYLYSYIKNGDRFDIEYYTDSQLIHKGFYSLNSSGHIDSSYLFNEAAGIMNSAGKYYYNAENRPTRQISYYRNYTNDVKIFYNGDNVAYWIYDHTNHLHSTTFKDSIVFEFYHDLELKVPFGYGLESRFGVANKNLVKRRVYYNLANNNSDFHRTYEYEYTLDEIGLVTQEIRKIVNQPSGNFSRIDTTNFTYTRIE